MLARLRKCAIVQKRTLICVKVLKECSISRPAHTAGISVQQPQGTLRRPRIKQLGDPLPLLTLLALALQLLLVPREPHVL